MIKIGEKVKEKIKDSYWTSGASIFNNGYVGDISVLDEKNTIQLFTEVDGTTSTSYDTDIYLNKINMAISHYCSCISYGRTTGCKHIGALARKIDDEYTISEDCSVKEKSTSKIAGGDYRNGDNNDESTNMANIEPGELGKLFTTFKEDPDLLREFMKNKGLSVSHIPDNLLLGIFKGMVEDAGANMTMNKEKVVTGKLKIFTKLEKNAGEKFDERVVESEEKLYKWKLDFKKLSHYSKELDIELCLYKGKILKNGSISSGKQIFRSGLSGIPYKFKKHAQFLEHSKGGGYWSKTPEQITFLGAPDFFLQNLFSINETIYKKESNKAINIITETHQLKIHIDAVEGEGNNVQNKTEKNGDSGNKAEKKYCISLVLIGDKGEKAQLKKWKLIGQAEKQDFAVLSQKNKMYFFKSELDYDFISQLNIEHLILNEREFGELQKSPYFASVLQNVDDVEALGIDTKAGNPVGKIVVEMDEDFEKVTVEKVVDYGDNRMIHSDNFGELNFFILEDNSIIQRNISVEKRLFTSVKKLVSLADTSSEWSCTKSITDAKEEELEDFFNEIESLIEGGFQVEYRQAAKRVSSESIGVEVSVESGIDFFDTHAKLTLGNKELEEYAEFLTLLGKSKDKKSITLKSGMTILVKDDLGKSFGALTELGITGKDIGKTVQISKYNIGLLQNKKDKNSGINFTLDNETQQLKKSLLNFSGIKKVLLPKNVKATLRDYQHTGYNWMNFLENYNFSGILADDMGLGKTLQTLSVLQKVYNEDTIKTTSLVICPTSLVYNWLDEAQKFTPDLRVEHVETSKTGFGEIKKNTQVIIVSYGIMANLVEAGKIPKSFHYLVLDESQNIKNPAAKRTKTICKIAAKYRLALSGTPIENNLMELWSAFNFLMPGFLNTLSHFKAKYVGKSDETDLKKLSEKVKPFILRRTKEEVLTELPAKQEEVLKLEMLPEQKAFYTKLKTAFKLQITKELEEQGLNKARFKVLDSLLKLRQACLTPELVSIKSDSTSMLLGKDIMTKESIKLRYIEENIDDMLTSGHNLLIFSQFTGFLEFIREILEKRKIGYNYIDGKVKSKDRKALVDEFNEGKKQVFVISLKAGGTGLNLTKADYVIHLDPWWNPAVENQATDRAHRMGQKKTVFVKKLICKDSIEEKILELQEKKKKLIDDVFSGNFTGSLSREDIDFIFE